MKYISPYVIRQISILLLLILFGGLITFKLIPYLNGILGAITVYIISIDIMERLVKKGWNANLAAIFLMALSFFCVMIPLAGLGFMIVSKMQFAIDNSEKVINATKDQLENLETYLNVDIASKIDTSAITSWLSSNLQSFAGSTFNMFISIVIMYFLLFFMLVNKEKMKSTLFEYLPIKDKNLQSIGKEVNEKVRANAIGIPTVALAQGIVSLIGFLIFGISDPFFWATIVTVGAMIPFVGSALGTIPVFLLSLSNGETYQAWGILLFGILAIGPSDNLLRLYVLKKLNNVHPLITLIGVLIGVPLFGFIGLIFGPLLISLFLVILKIYKKEFGQA